MKETSGSATEEGSISQDGQTWNRWHVYRSEQQSHNLHFHWQNIWYSSYYICKVIRSRRRLSRQRHRQVVPNPQDLLSTMMTWKRAVHTRQLAVKKKTSKWRGITFYKSTCIWRVNVKAVANHAYQNWAISSTDQWRSNIKHSQQ